MRVGALSVVALATLASCGGGRSAATVPPPAAAAAADAGTSVDRELLRDIASGLQEVLATMAVITEGAPDCTAMATQLGTLFDDSAALFELAHTQGNDPQAGPALAAELDARSAAVQPVVDRISRGLGRCQLDAAVANVMERMPTL